MSHNASELYSFLTPEGSPSKPCSCSAFMLDAPINMIYKEMDQRAAKVSPVRLHYQYFVKVWVLMQENFTHFWQQRAAKVSPVRLHYHYFVKVWVLMQVNCTNFWHQRAAKVSPVRLYYHYVLIPDTRGQPKWAPFICIIFMSWKYES